MSFVPILFLTTFISAASLIFITGYRKYASLEERQIAAVCRDLFIQDFPILWWSSLLTYFFVTVFLLLCFGKYNVETLMDKEFVLKDHIIPFIILIAIFLPISFKNYLSSSKDLKYFKPYLFICVQLMTIFNSISMSIVFVGIINLILKK